MSPISERDPRFGPVGEIIHKRSYAATKPDGELEKWHETVVRVVDGNLSLVDDRYHEPNEREELIERIFEFEVIPAGRHLAMSGKLGRQFNYNCWVAGWHPKDVTRHFVFTFDQLMQGGGVGSNYSDRFVAKYPRLKSLPQLHIVCDPEHENYDEMVPFLSDEYSHAWSGCFRVPDSREGWCDALQNVMEAFWSPEEEVLVLDMSLIRPRGQRIRTFGGTSSGPRYLAEMLAEIHKLLATRVGARMQWNDAMLIDHLIAGCVVSGNVRRSARMAMKWWSDPGIFDFIDAKKQDGLHWSTNISVVIDDDFFRALRVRDEHAIKVMRKVTEGMFSNGEPGFYNFSRAMEGEINKVYVTNPCVTGDTVIATLEGPRTMKDLADDGKDVMVYAWHPETKKPVVRWMRRPRKTRTKAKLLAVEFDSGLVVRCTPDHNFFSFRGNKVQAKDLKIGSSVRAWSMSEHRDGHLRVHGWDSANNRADHQWVARMVYECANGEILEGHKIHHEDEDKSNNLPSNLKMMTDYEHQSHHYPARFAAGFDGTAPNHKVVSVSQSGYADVYNGTVDDAHSYVILDPDPVAGIQSGIISANCGEIPLPEWGGCNLGHINLDAYCDPRTGQFDFVRAEESFRLMSRFLLRATWSDMPSPLSRRSVDEERRIGVGFTGFHGWLVKQGIRWSESHHSPYVHKTLRDFHEVVRKEARRYAFSLRIPEPVKCTTLAPVGTGSKLPGVSESMEPIKFRYFEQRIRFSADDANVEEQAAKGYAVEDDTYTPNTKVVVIPCKNNLLEQLEHIHGEERAEWLLEEASEIPLDDMLAVQQMVQSEYADNAISFTVNRPPDEVQQAWIEEHPDWDIQGLSLPLPEAGYLADAERTLRHFLPRLKGTTVMVDGSRTQAPFTKISKEAYEASVTHTIAESFDGECAGGACDWAGPEIQTAVLS